MPDRNPQDRSSRSTGQHRILAVLATYPSRTETFIAREIDAMRRCGIDVAVYALRSDHSVAGPRPRWHRGSWSLMEVFRAFLRCAAQRPLRLARGLADVAAGLRHPLYGLKALRNAVAALPLVFAIETEGIDWVHGHFADIPADVALFLGTLTKRSVTISAHARDIFVQPVRLTTKCQSAVAVFACTSWTTEHLSRLAPGAVVRLAYHGLDFRDPFWDQLFEERRRLLGDGRWPRRPARLLAVARFVPKKGLHVLTQALANLVRHGVAVECRMVGGGAERQRLLDTARQLGLDAQVKLLGAVEPDQLRAHWQWCDLLVQPSVIAADGDRDGIPNAVIEAQACGIPVVASDLPTLREIVQPGETGYLVTPGDDKALADTIASVLRDPRTVTQIVDAARSWARERFDVDRNVRSMLEFRLPEYRP